MSKQPMGKTLLRNVIRQTDAHNKIQEEMEMWKMRGWEIQTSSHKETIRGHMHCDRVSDQPTHVGRGKEHMSEHDDREARYWTRKLYEFEATDPDRWGHSGFKELYPEEFERDSDRSVNTKKTAHHKMKKSKSDAKACLSKRSKKSAHKKKKKKKKKAEDEKRRKVQSSSTECSADEDNDTKNKQKKKRTKSRHKRKKTVRTRRRDEDTSSGDSDNEEKKERRTKRRKRGPLKDSDSELDSKRKRKNWKATGEESSDDTTD